MLNESNFNGQNPVISRIFECILYIITYYFLNKGKWYCESSVYDWKLPEALLLIKLSSFAVL